MTIRQALLSDIVGVMDAFEEAKKIMQAGGNFQWDDDYPLRADFERDINDGVLYIIDCGGAAAGFICLNSDEPEEYSGVPWQGSGNVLAIHRMAVAPAFRGRGFAGKLLCFAVRFAEKNRISSLRTDTSSENVPMNALLSKHGFCKKGEIKLKWRKHQLFYCYEKILRNGCTK